MLSDQSGTLEEERELILLAQRGDRRAFEDLVYRYDRKVLAIAASYTGNNLDDAKDVYQEVFLRVFKALPKFRFDSRFSTWLYRIVVNVCLTQQSRRKRREVDSLDFVEDEESKSLLEKQASDERSSDEKAYDGEVARHVAMAMKTLSPQQRLVFTLRHYEGYKLREIAAMMNCAEGTVKKYLFTATVRLRDSLKPVLT